MLSNRAVTAGLALMMLGLPHACAEFPAPDPLMLALNQQLGFGTRGLTVNQSGDATAVSEQGATDSYELALAARPVALVTITITGDAQITMNGSAGPLTLTFPPDSWNVPQTVLIAAVNDSIREGTHTSAINHSLTSEDPQYANVSGPSVTVTITDNDTPGVTITESAGTTTATEAGATDSYTIVLDSEPVPAATITVTPDAQTTVNGGTIAVALTFSNVCPSATCWSTGYTITVGARDDNLQEGNHTGSISHTAASADPDYHLFAIGAVTVSITDNEVGGNVLSVPTFSATPNVTTLAGNGSSGTADGTGAVARFSDPGGITTDGVNVYVADTANHAIRKVVIATGVVTTLAGTAGSSGSTDGVGAAARFDQPQGITTDGVNVYVADTNNHVIRQIVIATGTVTTIAGTAGASGSTNGTGAAARFDSPRGITSTGGSIYVTDRNNETIRRVVTASGVVTTLAGSAGATGTTDGVGGAARFDGPEQITTDGNNLYVADRGNNAIRKIVISTATVSTILSGAGARGIATDGTNLYLSVGDFIQKYDALIAGGTLTTIAGTSGGFVDGSALVTARMDSPRALTCDGTSLYFVDRNNHSIRRYF